MRNSEPDLDSVRQAWAASTADDMYWHLKDYDDDVERQGQKFDAWFAEQIRAKQEEAFDAAVKMFFGGTSTHDLMLTTNPHRKAD